MKILNWFKYEYNSLVNYFVFKSLKKRADRLHATTGKQFHIVPFTENKMIIVSKKYHVPGVCLSLNFFNQQAKNKMKCIKYVDLIKIAYYSTK